MTKPEYYRIRENSDLVKNSDNKAILQTNNNELNKYRLQREEKLKLKNLVYEQEKMKSDLNEIKDLLRQLIGQNK